MFEPHGGLPEIEKSKTDISFFRFSTARSLALTDSLAQTRVSEEPLKIEVRKKKRTP